MGWSGKLKRVVFLIVWCFFASASYSAVICEEGWNEFGTWSSCLRKHRVPGSNADHLGTRPTDARRVGKVEKVEKNLDGSVTVWRHGSSDTEEWRQTNETTWERTR